MIQIGKSQKLFLVVLATLLTITVTTVCSGKTYAATNTLPSDGTRMAVAGPGSEFNAPISFNRLYVPVGQSATITFHKPSSSGSISMISVSAIIGNACSGTVYSRNLTPANGETVSTPDITGYAVDTITGIYNGVSTTFQMYCVQVSTNNTEDAPFYLTTNAGLLGNDRSATNGTGYVRDDNPYSGGGVWTKVISFAPACTIPAGTGGTIYLYDLDIGKAWSAATQGQITATLEKMRITTGQAPVSLGNIALEGDINSSGNITKTGENENFNINPVEGFEGGYSYILRLSNINDVNAIKIGLPFDQVNSAFTCGNPIRDVSCSVSGPITVVPGGAFSLPVRLNKEPDNASIANGGPNTGLHLGIAEQGNPSTWNDRGGTMNPPPDYQTTFIPLNGGLSNATYYSFDSNYTGTNFNYKRYWVDSMAANNINDATLRIQAPNSSGQRTLVVRILDRAGSSWEGSCSVTINVIEPPTCNASGFDTPVGLGGVFSRATATNTNNIAITVTSAEYRVIAANGNGAFSSGDTTNLNVPANGTRDYEPDSRTVNYPGLYRAEWYIDWSAAGTSGQMRCGANFTITYVDPTCRVDPFSVGTNDPFYPRVTVQNENRVAVGVSSATYNINTTPAINGNAGASPANVPVGPGVFRVYDSATEVRIPNRGVYTLRWTINWSIGNVTGSLPCQNDDGTVFDQPYVRFYGNDVFAGGGFGNACSTATFADARGYGVFTDTASLTHDNYRGTAAEMAVFALDQISFVLPGSMRARPTLQQLSYANTIASRISPSGGLFGGGYGSVYCAHDYWSDAPTAENIPQGAFSNNGVSINITNGSLTSGTYYRNNPNGITRLVAGNNTGDGLVDGRRLVIYVNGDVRIDANGTLRSFGFADSSWPTLSDIPSLYIISSGNIYIDRVIENIDAVLIAQSTVPGKGQIFTCAGTGDQLQLVDDSGEIRDLGDMDFVTRSCATKLTVNGAFIAKRVHLLRSLGTVRDSAATPYEPYTGNRIAEVFRFSPELYLTEGGGLEPESTTVRIDSLVSLPPSY